MLRPVSLLSAGLICRMLCMVMDDLMNEKRLFRAEVVDGRRNRNFGSVSINTPLNYTMVSFFLLMMLVLVFLFLSFGAFSEKFIVKGYLESTKGLARVYPQKNGVIETCFIQQGEEVKQGDKLFLITTSYDDFGKKGLHGVPAKLEKKRHSIEAEIRYQKAHLKALKPLLVKQYISRTTYHEQHDRWVALQHELNNVEVELMNVKHDKSYVVRSPIDGIISSMFYHEGQYTNVIKPLMNILPLHADLMAELFIPVSQAGFLHQNDNVIIRYDAFPYARFGTSNAIIQSISRSVETDEDEKKPIRIGQPYYKVSALLAHQGIQVYGKERAIQQGMTLTAVIVGARRKVWQWMIDPLYSFYGGMMV